jgi:hypothetical protein
MPSRDTFTDRCTNWGNFFFFAVCNTEVSNKMASYTTGQRTFVAKNFTILAVLVWLWRHNILDSSPFVLHQQQTLPTGSLNSSRKQEVRVSVINTLRDVNSSVLRSHEVCDLEGQHTQNVLV